MSYNWGCDLLSLRIDRLFFSFVIDVEVEESILMMSIFFMGSKEEVGVKSVI